MIPIREIPGSGEVSVAELDRRLRSVEGKVDDVLACLQRLTGSSGGMQSSGPTLSAPLTPPPAPMAPIHTKTPTRETIKVATTPSPSYESQLHTSPTYRDKHRALLKHPASSYSRPRGNFWGPVEGNGVMAGLSPRQCCCMPSHPGGCGVDHIDMGEGVHTSESMESEGSVGTEAGVSCVEAGGSVQSVEDAETVLLEYRKKVKELTADIETDVKEMMAEAAYVAGGAVKKQREQQQHSIHQHHPMHTVESFRAPQRSLTSNACASPWEILPCSDTVLTISGNKVFFSGAEGRLGVCQLRAALTPCTVVSFLLRSERSKACVLMGSFGRMGDALMYTCSGHHNGAELDQVYPAGGTASLSVLRSAGSVTMQVNAQNGPRWHDINRSDPLYLKVELHSGDEVTFTGTSLESAGGNGPLLSPLDMVPKTEQNTVVSPRRADDMVK